VSRWSPSRVATGLALAAWAILFLVLLLTGRSSLYLSSRTAWVVPVGAVLLSVAATGRLVSARMTADSPEDTLEARHSVGLLVLILPVVLILALPPTTLGSFAAARRSSIGAVGFVAPEEIAEGRLTLTRVAAGLRSPDGSRALLRRAGAEVSFVGFVSRDKGMGADEFVLTRFLVSCCVADALTVRVRVVDVPPGVFSIDEWVRVRGTLYPLSSEVLVDAASVERVTRPDDPYLNP
jgi:putative membrane protein